MDFPVVSSSNRWSPPDRPDTTRSFRDPAEMTPGRRRDRRRFAALSLRTSGQRILVTTLPRRWPSADRFTCRRPGNQRFATSTPTWTRWNGSVIPTSSGRVRRAGRGSNLLATGLAIPDCGLVPILDATRKDICAAVVLSSRRSGVPPAMWRAGVCRRWITGSLKAPLDEPRVDLEKHKGLPQRGTRHHAGIDPQEHLRTS